jgi:hypothetical protein
MTEVRRARSADADAIGRRLHHFNTESNEFTPGPRALAERVRNLLADGEITVLVAGADPVGLAVLPLVPRCGRRRSSATWRSSTSFAIGAARGLAGH